MEAKEILKLLYLSKDYEEVRSIIEDGTKTSEYVEEVSTISTDILTEYIDKVVRPEGFEFGTSLDGIEHFPDNVYALIYKGDLTALGNVEDITMTLFMETDMILPYTLTHKSELEAHNFSFCCMSDLEPELKKKNPDMSMARFYRKGELVLTVIGRKNTLIYLLASMSKKFLATEGNEYFIKRCEAEGDELTIGHFFAIPGCSGCACNRLIKNGIWHLADCLDDFFFG